jgi:hypothetical protein
MHAGDNRPRPADAGSPVVKTSQRYWTQLGRNHFERHGMAMYGFRALKGALRQPDSFSVQWQPAVYRSGCENRQASNPQTDDPSLTLSFNSLHDQYDHACPRAA